MVSVMSIEIPKRGTRGSSLANLPGPLKKVLLGLFELVVKLKKEPMGVLTTIGAKSGVERRNPLRPFDDGPGRWLVVASFGGAASSPAWLHNLKAHPDQVGFEVNGHRVRVSPATLTGAERDTAWERIVREAPQFAAYQKSTDRVIPVVRLTRIEG